MENLQIMDETLDQKLDAVMIELGALNHKLDALINALMEEDEIGGDEYGIERSKDAML